MIRRFFFLMNLGLAFSTSGQRDSASCKILNGIVIREGEYNLEQLRHSYFNLNQSITDNLDRYTPLNLKSYGSGMLTLAGIRGMSAEQTQIRWEGVPLNGAGTGLFDLSLFPAGLFGSVYINMVSGPTVSGSGSGGVLDMKSPLWEKGTRCYASYSSLGNAHLQFQTSGRKKSWNYTAGLTQAWLPNRFKYSDPFQPGHPKVWIAQNQTATTGGQWLLEKSYPAKGNIRLAGFYTGQSRHIQPPMGVPQSPGLQTDLGIRNTATITRANLRHGFRMLQFGSVLDRLTYTSLADTNKAWFHQLFGHYRLPFLVGKSMQLTPGIEYQLLTGWQKAYDKTHWESRVQPYVLFDWHVPNWSVGAGWRGIIRNSNLFRQAAHARISWEKIKDSENGYGFSVNQFLSYRLPTLNEQFFIPGGNPNLKPEQGFNTEIKGSGRKSFGNWSVVIVFQAYHILMENGIQWKPAGGPIWSPFNVKKYQSNGISSGVDVRYEPRRSLLFTVNASVQIQKTLVLASDIPGDASVGKQLIYQPPFSLRNTWQCQWKKESFLLFISSQSYRYIQFDNTAWLPGYTLIDTKWNHYWNGKNSREWVLTLECRNLLNASYQVVQNYAMPGRSFHLSLFYQIK